MYHIDITFGKTSPFGESKCRLDGLSKEFIEGFQFSQGIICDEKILKFTAGPTTNVLPNSDISYCVIPSIDITPNDKLNLQSKYDPNSLNSTWYRIAFEIFVGMYDYVALITLNNESYHHAVEFRSIDFLSGVKTYASYMKFKYPISITCVRSYSLNTSYYIKHQYIDRMSTWITNYNSSPESILCLRYCKVTDVVIILILKFLLGSQFPKSLKVCGRTVDIEECRTRILHDNGLCDICGDNMKYPLVTSVKLVEFD